MIYVPSRMGQLNRRALLRQLQKLDVASRADLAKALGMSQPTAGKIVDELIAAGVLEETGVIDTSGAESGLRGRPGRKLRLNRSKSQLLAIQLGCRKPTSPGCRSARPRRTNGTSLSRSPGTRLIRRPPGRNPCARRPRRSAAMIFSACW
jgi:hypothetical protein